MQIYKNQGVNRFSNFSNIACSNDLPEENEPFERDYEMTLNENTFHFKENLDSDDEQLKLPDDIFNKFSHDRKSSNDSDDMVKYDNDTRFDFSPQKDKIIQDFESTDYVLKKINQSSM